MKTSASLVSMALAEPGFSMPDPATAASGGPVAALPVWLARTDGTILDTIAMLPTRHRALVVFSRPDTLPDGAIRVGMRPGGNPFMDSPILSVDATSSHVIIVGRAVDAASSAPSYVVHRLSPEGDTLSTRHYAYEPVPLTEARIEGAARRRGMVTDDSAESMGIVEAAMYKPPWPPPVSDAIVDRDGWLWIRREDVPDASLVTWDILDPAGNRVGAVALDANIEVRAVGGLSAWGTEKTADDRTRLWHVRVHATVSQKR